MKNKYQMIHTYTFDTSRGAPGEHTERSSFKTLESAEKSAWFWINKAESWIDTTVVSIKIVNKETGAVEFEYHA